MTRDAKKPASVTTPKTNRGKAGKARGDALKRVALWTGVPLGRTGRKSKKMMSRTVMRVGPKGKRPAFLRKLSLAGNMFEDEPKISKPKKPLFEVAGLQELPEDGLILQSDSEAS